MFAAGQQVIDVSFCIAQSRLASLIRGGRLSAASAEVYQRSNEDLLRVGPFGERQGASRLVRVQITDPAFRDDAMRVGLRWEALGVTGGLFPALDADIVLTPDGDQTRVTLTGTYRPPLGSLGAGLDRLVLRRVAAATVAAFLKQVSVALEEAPAGQSRAVVAGPRTVP